ncbi:MAG TPA: hypothetical protein VF092_02610 [Longimicrobium sp.]
MYMAMAGAPTIHLFVNALALVMGLAFFAIMRSSERAPRLPGGIAVVLGGLLLTTALFGVSIEGVSRWIRIGGLTLQMSLIVLPAMLVAFAQRRDLLATLSMILTAVALALQPDRAMAGVLVSALAVLGVRRRDRWVASAFAMAVASFVVTLVRPDSLPAVPYVDQILYTAFQVHAMAGMAVVIGTLLLIVPAIVGQRLDPNNRDVYAVFGAAWLGMVVAAALGNYPTPLVGYGGSAILGYAFSLALMPGTVRSAAVAEGQAGDAVRAETDGDADLRIDIAYG